MKNWHFPLLAGGLATVTLSVGCPGDSLKETIKETVSKKKVAADGYELDYSGEKASRKREGKITAGIEEVVVVNRFGPVSVEATEGSYGWSWEVRAWGATKEVAEQLTKEIKLSAKDSGRLLRLELALPAPSTRLKGVKSILSLKVPASVSVQVKMGHGDTKVRGISGEVEVTAKHGSVSLEGLKKGPVRCETSYGDISAKGLPVGAKLVNQHGKTEAWQAKGDLTIQSKHGKVLVRGVRGTLRVTNEHGEVDAMDVEGKAELQTSNAKLSAKEVEGGCTLQNDHGPIEGRRLGGAIEAKTSYGTIDLRSASAGTVHCQNAHGDVKLQLSSPKLKKIEARTSHGDLAATIPQALQGRFSLRTSHGQIKAPETVKVQSKGDDSSAKWEEAGATFGVTLENEHGSITLKRPEE